MQFKHFIYAFFIAFLSLSMFLLGKHKGGKNCDEQAEVSQRYLETFGSPTTEEEQRMFDYVVYNEIINY